jgi:ribonuclease HI
VNAIIACDGASRGNPGPSAAAAAIWIRNGGRQSANRQPDAILGVKLGNATCNEAEYAGVIAGLVLLRRFGVNNARIYCDSQLVIRQMSGEYKCKSTKLARLRRRAMDALKHLEQVEFVHACRELTCDADGYATQALNGTIETISLDALFAEAQLRKEVAR